MGSRVKSIACPFCYPETFLTASSSRSRKARECPYCRRTFFYWKERYYICVNDIRSVRMGAGIQ